MELVVVDVVDEGLMPGGMLIPKVLKRPGDVCLNCSIPF